MTVLLQRQKQPGLDWNLPSSVSGELEEARYLMELSYS